jgi:hypothetical protein
MPASLRSSNDPREEDLDTILGLMAGVGLSAACGFRVFVPFLGLSLAAMNGYVTLADGFSWLGTWPAFLALLTATGFEIAAYYVPIIDNLLDVIAVPVAVMAGILAMAAVALDLPPFLKWSLAVIAGGGVAGVVQGGAILTRALATMHLPGPGNFFVATLELLGATGMTLLALLVPLAALATVLIILSWAAMKWSRSHRSSRKIDVK